LKLCLTISNIRAGKDFFQTRFMSGVVKFFPAVFLWRRFGGFGLELLQSGQATLFSKQTAQVSHEKMNIT
jgi:hypothetical protein